MTRIREYIAPVAFRHVVNAEGDRDAPLQMEPLNLRRKRRIVDVKQATGYHAIETFPKVKDRVKDKEGKLLNMVV